MKEPAGVLETFYVLISVEIPLVYICISPLSCPLKTYLLYYM